MDFVTGSATTKIATTTGVTALDVVRNAKIGKVTTVLRIHVNRSAILRRVIGVLAMVIVMDQNYVHHRYNLMEFVMMHVIILPVTRTIMTVLLIIVMRLVTKH